MSLFCSTLFQRLRLLRVDGGAVRFVLGGEVVGELDLEFVLDGFTADGALGPGVAERAKQDQQHQPGGQIFPSEAEGAAE